MWTSEQVPGRVVGSKLVALPGLTPAQMQAKWQAAMDEAAEWQRQMKIAATTSATISAEPPSCEQLREALRLTGDSIAVALRAKTDADEASRVAAQASQRLAGAIATLQAAAAVIARLMQDAGCGAAPEPHAEPVPDTDLHMGEP